MGLINITTPSDGETADAADVATPLNTIVNEFNGNISNANIATAAAIAGSKLASGGVGTTQLADASVTNAKLATSSGEVGAVWVAWTPTYTNFTLGNNGTLNYANYTTVGKTVHFRLKITLGSDSAVSGEIAFSAPATLKSEYVDNDTINATVQLVDSGTARFEGVCLVASSTSFKLRALNASTTYSAQTNISSTVPMTWTTNDVIMVSGTYEKAA